MQTIHIIIQIFRALESIYHIYTVFNVYIHTAYGKQTIEIISKSFTNKKYMSDQIVLELYTYIYSCITLSIHEHFNWSGDLVSNWVCFVPTFDADGLNMPFMCIGI